MRRTKINDQDGLKEQLQRLMQTREEERKGALLKWTVRLIVHNFCFNPDNSARQKFWASSAPYFYHSNQSAQQLSIVSATVFILYEFSLFFKIVWTRVQSILWQVTAQTSEKIKALSWTYNQSYDSNFPCSYTEAVYLMSFELWEPCNKLCIRS